MRVQGEDRTGHDSGGRRVMAGPAFYRRASVKRASLSEVLNPHENRDAVHEWAVAASQLSAAMRTIDESIARLARERDKNPARSQ